MRGEGGAEEQNKCERSEVSGEAPPALPVEGVLNPTAVPSGSEVSGEAPPALPVEGVLNPQQCRAEAR